MSRTLLNKQGSEKETWHVEFDLSRSGLDYTVGDSFGIMPMNDPALVDAIIRALDAPPDFPIGGRTLRDVLTDGVSLGPAPDMLFQLYLLYHRRRAAAEGKGARRRRRSGRRRRDPRRARRDREISAASGRTPKRSSKRSIRCSRGSIRSRHRPRSIPGRVSLTVDAVRYQIGERDRLGVASTFLAERATPGDKVKVYVRRRTISACRRSVGAYHHGRPRHRHRAVPRLPARAHGDQGAAAATGCSSATSAATAIFSTRTNSTA